MADAEFVIIIRDEGAGRSARPPYPAQPTIPSDKIEQLSAEQYAAAQAQRRKGAEQFPATDPRRFAYSEGGVVGGSGRGDKIPALLEPKEFVVRSEQAQKPGVAQLLNSINSGKEGPPVAQSQNFFYDPPEGAGKLIPGLKIQPDAVYHGTTRDFSEFDERYQNPDAAFGPGFYFTENRAVAEKYRPGGFVGEGPGSRVVNSQLKINNPFLADEPISQEVVNKLSQAAGNIDLSGFAGEFAADLYGHLQDTLGARATRDVLEKAGYDAVAHIDEDDLLGLHRVWMVFHKEQIKQLGKGYSQGGNVDGQGKGDTVPAMLEPKEFVVRSDVASKPDVLASLERLNKTGSFGGAQHFHSGGPVAHMASGGTVNPIDAGWGPVGVALTAVSAAATAAEKGLRLFGESATSIASGDTVGLARSFGTLAGQIPLVGGVIQGVVNLGLDMMQGAEAQARRLSQYDAGLAIAVARFDVNQIFRDLESARTRGPALVRGMEERNRFQDAMERLITENMDQMIDLMQTLVKDLPPLIRSMMHFYGAVRDIAPNLFDWLSNPASLMDFARRRVEETMNRLRNIEQNTAPGTNQDITGITQALQGLSARDLLGGSGMPDNLQQLAQFQFGQFPAFGGL